MYSKIAGPLNGYLWFLARFERGQQFLGLLRLGRFRVIAKKGRDDFRAVSCLCDYPCVIPFHCSDFVFSIGDECTIGKLFDERVIAGSSVSEFRSLPGAGFFQASDPLTRRLGKIAVRIFGQKFQVGGWCVVPFGRVPCSVRIITPAETDNSDQDEQSQVNFQACSCSLIQRVACSSSLFPNA